MKSLRRIFTTYYDKGKRNYINSQKKYEILRTLLYFTISLSLFISGIIVTKTRMNLLTVIAVLGCLPACKSMVGMIMFLKFKSLPHTTSDKIETSSKSLDSLYDLVFTSYDHNYQVDHLVLKDHTICGYSSSLKTDENKCQNHLKSMLSQSGYKGFSIKIYNDLDKYLLRLEQLKAIHNDDIELRTNLYNTLKSISL